MLNYVLINFIHKSRISLLVVGNFKSRKSGFQN